MMLIGDSACTSGMSKKIYEELLKTVDSTYDFTYIDTNGNTVNVRTQFENKLKNTAYATATYIVEYLQDNADIQVRSNITIDAQFWTWFNLFIGVLVTNGGVTLSPAMILFLATNPIPKTIVSQSNKVLSTQDGVQ